MRGTGLTSAMFEGQFLGWPAVLAVGVGVADKNPTEAVVVIIIERGKPMPPIPPKLDDVRIEIIRSGPIDAFDDCDAKGKKN